jgi:hypothetical protein
VVFPSETLQANIWKEGGRFVATITAPSRDEVVVSSGVELVPAAQFNLGVPHVRAGVRVCLKMCGQFGLDR